MTFATLSPDGRYLASSSEENVNIWEASTGRRIRSLPTGSCAVAAYSPDNKLLLTGKTLQFEGTAIDGPFEIKLWDTHTGLGIKTIQGFPKALITENLEFSEDGRYFLASIDNQTYVWNNPGYKLLHRLDGIGHFAPNGKQMFLESDSSYLVDIATGSRVFVEAPLKNTANDKVRVDNRYTNSLNLEALEIALKGLLDSLNVDNPSSGADRVSVLNRLYTEREIFTLTNYGRVHIWDYGQKQELSNVKLALPEDSSLEIKDSRFSEDGSLLAIHFLEDSLRHQFAVFDTKTGKKLSLAAHFLNDNEEARDYFGFWGIFSKDLESFVQIPLSYKSGFEGGMRAVNTKTGKQIFEFGIKKLESTILKNRLSSGENTVMGVYNGGEFFMVESSFEVNMFYPETGNIVSFMGSLPEDAGFIRDEKWELTRADDLIYNLKEKATGELMAQILIDDGTISNAGSFELALEEPYHADWVVTTPSGLFDASPEMMNKLHYAVGLETIGLDQLKARYHEPGLLPMILGTSRGEIRDVSNLNLVDLYPVIDASIANGFLDISLTERQGGLGNLRLAVNGSTKKEDINLERKTSLRIDLKPYDKFCLPGQNTVSLVAENKEGWLESASYDLSYTPLGFSRGNGEASNTNISLADSRNASLYILCVGTSKYRGDVKSLVYPDLDAAAMANALGTVGRGLFNQRVEVKLLSTADSMSSADISSKQNIEEAFKHFAKAKPEDVLVVYFSGHGKTFGEGDQNLFYYLTKDATDPDLKDPVVRKNAAISTVELTEWLTKIPALKQVLIFDACNSGKAAESLSSVGARALSPSQIRALDRMKDRTGMFILSGSAANQLSYEASEFGQGLLTYSLLEGMSSSTSTVDVMTLFQYSRDRVPVLAKQIREVQIPIMAFPIGGGSFEIGLKKPGVKIPLSQKKPVFIHCAFQDKMNFKDRLKLGDALAEKLLTLSARGAQSPLVYIDTQSYDDGYSIIGQYSSNNDGSGRVDAEFGLFKNDTLLKRFNLEGKEDNVPDLAGSILNEALKEIKK
ncbi:MAG: caspase family protein [Saprospiraceae bacterium]